MLRLPNFELEFIMTTDASSPSVGAVIEQDQGRGLQPVAYGNRKLSDTEARYSAYERGLLGIVSAIGNGVTTSKDVISQFGPTTPPFFTSPTSLA